MSPPAVLAGLAIALAACAGRPAPSTGSPPGRAAAAPVTRATALARAPRPAARETPGAPAPEPASYVAADVERGGAVSGVVRSSGAAAAGAVVFLADVEAGRPVYPIGGVLELGDRGFWPPVQVVAPPGARLHVVSRVGAARAIRVSRFDVDDPRGPLDAALPAHGDRELALEEDGIYRVGSDDGAIAWLVVAPHPYHAVTDADGRFRLTGVPPGAYDLEAWQAPQGGAPRRGRVRVEVLAGRSILQGIDLK